MKKLILILICTIIYSCETKNVSVKSTEFTINGRTLDVYTIDSCEYIGKIYGGNTDIITHKGNCKNPIHNK